MKILWLSTTPGLYGKLRSNRLYNGCGWISSLQELFIDEQSIEIGLTFLTSQRIPCTKSGNMSYFPIYQKPKTIPEKIREYYGGYKQINSRLFVKQIKQIIDSFKPDVIHLFGVENPLANILGNTDVPIVVHLQGLLAPCNNAFFPIDFNKLSFLWPFSTNEWVSRNGYIYAKNSIEAKAKREKDLFKNIKFIMGRTEWDFQYSQLLSPKSKYFHIDEVLRPCFYRNQSKWAPSNLKRFVIISTISNTIYKGLDLILKTANILRSFTNIEYEWHVVGVSCKDRIVSFFESQLNLNSQSLHIVYKGVQPAEELCQQLLNSSLYVHPSYIDNSPNSLCEAQMIGVPVISTNVGGTSSLIKHKETGILIPANAPYELTYWINKIYNDRNLAIRLSKKGILESQNRHNKTSIKEDLVKTYHEILDADR